VVWNERDMVLQMPETSSAWRRFMMDYKYIRIK